MKIISWNVNWIRAIIKKNFLTFFDEYKPDIFCIQETKAFENQIPQELDAFLNWNNYSYIWHNWQKSWYAWTAIFVKNKVNFGKSNYQEHILKNEILNQDWRITILSTQDFELLNVYFPNGWTRADWTEMLTYKLKFYDELINLSDKIVEDWKNIIICWDFNICHKSIDIARPKENENSIWFLPIERQKISEFLSHGYIDVFRYFYPNLKDQYTWRSYRAGARQRNVWRRLDYFFVNKNFLNNIKAIKHLTDIMGSDHCPILLELK